MEEGNIAHPSQQKIYKEKAIWVGTLLGGPLVMGYMVAENYKAFDQPKKASVTWRVTILATVVIFLLAIFLPDESPNMFLPLTYSLIGFYTVKYYQGEAIAMHLQSGREAHSWWRVIGIALAGIIVTFLIIFMFLSLIGE